MGPPKTKCSLNHMAGKILADIFILVTPSLPVYMVLWIMGFFLMCISRKLHIFASGGQSVRAKRSAMIPTPLQTFPGQAEIEMSGCYMGDEYLMQPFSSSEFKDGKGSK